MKQYGKNELFKGNQNIFIADIHSEGDKLESLISNLKSNVSNFNEYRLVFLGDIIGKGVQTIKTLTIMKELQQNYQVFIIDGNWEQQLAKHVSKRLKTFRNSDTLEHSLENKSYSFLKEFSDIGMTKIKDVSDFWEQSQFDSVFKTLLPYFESDTVIATHAPINERIAYEIVTKNETLDSHKTSLRNQFIKNESEPIISIVNKLFICGHQNAVFNNLTQEYEIRNKPSVYGNKIFLDCGGAGTTLSIPIYAYVENLDLFIHS